jgi:hypothetical protein
VAEDLWKAGTQEAGPGSDAIVWRNDAVRKFRFRMQSSEDAEVCASLLNLLEAKNAEFRGLLVALLPRHHGSCCIFDEKGKVVVTERSCVCAPAEKRVRRALSLWNEE